MIDAVFSHCRYIFLNSLQLHFVCVVELLCLLEVLDLFDVFLHIPVVWCVELDDVSLSVFSCVSVRGCSGSHYSLSLSISIRNQRG